MNRVMENSSVVIIAKDFNLSILKPLWLMNNKIFRPEELEGDIVVTPPAVQIQSVNFQFVALLDRLQVSIPRVYGNGQSDINRVCGGIVKALPHTPYTAIGLNFHYLGAPQSREEFASWEKELFASPWAREIEGSQAENARFGSYLSFDAIGTRLKIDIKPTNAGGSIGGLCSSWHPGQELIRVHFNYHTDVTNTDAPAETVVNRLAKWEEALAMSTGLVENICK